MSKKHNLVIRDKKLPKNVANDRKNWEHSNEGKHRKKEAQVQQKNFQGALDNAMMKKKRETGTTGMKDHEYRALIGNVGERFSKRTVLGGAGKRLPANTKTYAMRMVDGKRKLVQVSGPRD
ncbi:MAG: hypothetical protein F4118_00540 [Acidimicrobiaceae bacterium]|nr:hypothetical protein [Candidatus Poribacteria bacterium]MYI34909.1 hypothetical protein [Acidimicrobiaceae bacterium]